MFNNFFKNDYRSSAFVPIRTNFSRQNSHQIKPCGVKMNVTKTQTIDLEKPLVAELFRNLKTDPVLESGHFGV